MKRKKRTYIVKTYWENKPLSCFKCASYKEMRSLKDNLDRSDKLHPTLAKHHKVIVSVI